VPDGQLNPSWPPGARRLIVLPETATRYLFFVGKGGVGKSAVACATAIDLSDRGRKVLLISTDPASNLDEMLETGLGPKPQPIPGVPGLFAMNLEPTTAAADYRERVLGPLREAWPSDRVAAMEEELAGACTVEIALLDAFAALLTDDAVASQFDHILFDTAPTGHTLRLLELSGLWSTFLSGFDEDLPLRPYLGLREEVARLDRVVATLRDATETMVVLVARPERAPIAECQRALDELQKLGINHYMLVMNAVFRASDRSDAVALAMERRANKALADLPAEVAGLPRVTIPLRAGPLVGAAALRGLLLPESAALAPSERPNTPPDLPSLETLVEEIAQRRTGLIVVVGKGGVGKTTVAAALAVALAEQGLDVELTTTDPAGQLDPVVGGHPPNLMVHKPDPEIETSAYVESVVDFREKDMAPEELGALKQEMASPCAEEVAMFRAFARMVAAARSKIVVIDAAATGHTLLLMDKTGAYHREMADELSGQGIRHVVTPLMRLQDPTYSKVIIVTLAEATPVSEAASLQDELRDAGVEPWAWVINESLAKSGTRDPILARRIADELAQIQRVSDGLAHRLAVVAWLPEEPRGTDGLHQVISVRLS
jgi:arsenite-transporting ATPase